MPRVPSAGLIYTDVSDCGYFWWYSHIWFSSCLGRHWLDFKEGGGRLPRWRRTGRLLAELLRGHCCWEFTVLCAVLGLLEPWIGVFWVILIFTTNRLPVAPGWGQRTNKVVTQGKPGANKVCVASSGTCAASLLCSCSPSGQVSCLSRVISRALDYLLIGCPLGHDAACHRCVRTKGNNTDISLPIPLHDYVEQRQQNHQLSSNKEFIATH